MPTINAFRPCASSAPASTVAAFAIGVLAVLLASRIKCPAEVCFFPALLPMIPGIYAYRTIEALLSCLYYTQGNSFAYYFHLLAYNGLTCTFIILGMVTGATVPLFLFKKLSFTAFNRRPREKLNFSTPVKEFFKHYS